MRVARRAARDGGTNGRLAVWQIGAEGLGLLLWIVHSDSRALVYVFGDPGASYARTRGLMFTFVSIHAQ